MKNLANVVCDLLHIFFQLLINYDLYSHNCASWTGRIDISIQFV